MTRKKHLFIGFGDIASRCCDILSSDPRSANDHLIGVARGERDQFGVEFWRGDVSCDDILQRIDECDVDTIIITLSPSGSSEDDYRTAYLKPVQALVKLWLQKSPRGKIIYISSTSVYGQHDGQWVDHESLCEPQRPSANILRQSEKAVLTCAQSTVVRFSGIYGGGRDYLLRQVMQGKGGGDTFTNRIHVEDCCAAIVHLMHLQVKKLAPVYVASDKTPVKSREIRMWLAQQLGLDPMSLNFSEQVGRAGNKRCDSRLLSESGFSFRYPSYKEGYLAEIDAFKHP